MSYEEEAYTFIIYNPNEEGAGQHVFQSLLVLTKLLKYMAVDVDLPRWDGFFLLAIFI